jgi:ADP-heptose:LPS heptosyltransferase/predicted SAM-dependent methyltransferase
MVWRKDDPTGNESRKIVWEVTPYLRGRGIDLGAGDFKVLPHVMSVDNCHHNCFGYNIKPDVYVQDAADLSVFASQSMDFVYSSHLLEHMEKPDECLKEWYRLVKPGGYLVLYLPHEDLYPKMGEDGANPDHKWNLNNDMVIEWMKKLPAWDLVQNQVRNEEREYSFLQVYKKTNKLPKIHQFSCDLTKLNKTVLVCRFGAYGDLMQASSVFAGLKDQGYEVTLMCSPPGVDVVLHDPNIDHFMILDKDQVPNGDLLEFWNWQAKNYDKFINLSESVEGTLLGMGDRVVRWWNPTIRHQRMNFNYVEFQHQIAEVPHKPQVKFYPTLEERAWARKQRLDIKADHIVMWSLAGSSVHKVWAGMDNVIAAILLEYPNTAVLLVGGPEAQMLEAGWENEPRVHRTCGKWSIRQSMAFLDEVDLVIGPETGMLNAASQMDCWKVCLLSHSTWENLTRDWKNTIAVWSEDTECKGRGKNEVTACHMLHYTWEHCTKHEESGTAQCQFDIKPQEIWEAVNNILYGVSKKLIQVAGA